MGLLFTNSPLAVFVALWIFSSHSVAIVVKTHTLYSGDSSVLFPLYDTRFGNFHHSNLGSHPQHWFPIAAWSVWKTLKHQAHGSSRPNMKLQNLSSMPQCPGGWKIIFLSLLYFARASNDYDSPVCYYNSLKPCKQSEEFRIEKNYVDISLSSGRRNIRAKLKQGGKN